jgi:hypothetical protein
MLTSDVSAMNSSLNCSLCFLTPSPCISDSSDSFRYIPYARWYLVVVDVLSIGFNCMGFLQECRLGVQYWGHHNEAAVKGVDATSWLMYASNNMLLIPAALMMDDLVSASLGFIGCASVVVLVQLLDTDSSCNMCRCGCSTHGFDDQCACYYGDNLCCERMCTCRMCCARLFSHCTDSELLPQTEAESVKDSGK